MTDRVTPTSDAPPTMSDREIDQQLVERVQRGDKQAFGLLVAKYQRKLARLLSRLIRDPAEVEDVAQETFIKAYRALPSFGRQRFLYLAVSHRDQHRQKLPRFARPSQLQPQPISIPTKLKPSRMGISCAISTRRRLLMTKQIGDTVNVAMEACLRELRTAIVWGDRRFELRRDRLDHGMPIGTVRSRIFRAREAISEKSGRCSTRLRTRGGKTMKEKVSALLDGALDDEGFILNVRIAQKRDGALRRDGKTLPDRGRAAG